MLDGQLKESYAQKVDQIRVDALTNYYELGGLLGSIRYGGDCTRQEFVEMVKDRWNYDVRSVYYWISIHTVLVVERIKWEEVARLGWTKIKTILPYLTRESLQHYVHMAKYAESVKCLEREVLKYNGLQKDPARQRWKSRIHKSKHMEANEATWDRLYALKGKGVERLVSMDRPLKLAKDEYAVYAVYKK